MTDKPCISAQTPDSTAKFSPQPAYIVIDQQAERTIYSWRREPWQWIGKVGLFLFLMGFIYIPLLLPGKYSETASHSMRNIASVFFLIYLLFWLLHKWQKVEISRDGIRISRIIFGKEFRVRSVALDKVMGAKAFSAGLGGWRVGILSPDYHGGISTGALASREDAEWLAKTIEAEVKALGVDL